MRTNYAATVLLILISFQLTQAVEASEAFAIMVKAYQKSGFNPNLIHTGVAEFEITTDRGQGRNVHSAIGEELFQKDVDRIKEQHKGDEARITLELKRIRDSYEETNRRVVQQKVKILFSGNDRIFGDEPGEKYKRLYEIYEYLPSQNRWIHSRVDLSFGSLLHDPNIVNSQLHVRWMPGDRDLAVQDATMNFGEFQKFGRFQEEPGSHISAIIRRKIDRRTFALSADFQEFAENRMRDLGLDINVTGEIDYDGGAIAKIVEVKKGNRLLEKYHIDVDRGYLCPYQYTVDESGDYFREITATGYIVEEKTGLYYPTSYSEIVSLTIAGAVNKTDAHYRLVPDTLRLNHAVSDHEFSIDIPEDARVADFRIMDKPVRYIAVNKGTVSLAKGGYDFANMKWLQREYSPEDYIPSASGMTGWTRWVFTGIGIILILLALRRLLWKKVH